MTIGKLPFKRKKSSTKSSRDTGRNGNGCNGNSHWTPSKETERFFGGKRGYHTWKSQLVADKNTREIICVFCGKGRGHDFSLFKKSRIRFHPLTTSREDSVYQGIAAYHSNSYTPKKKPKNRKLTELEKGYNKALAKERIIIEPINRVCGKKCIGGVRSQESVAGRFRLCCPCFLYQFVYYEKNNARFLNVPILFSQHEHRILTGQKPYFKRVLPLFSRP